jgi:hypothetical protein
MLGMSKKFVVIAAGLVLLAAPIAALAAHGKAGLWQITVTIGGTNMHMPDMSKLPPDVQARMRAAGVGMGGNTITAQHCMSAQDFAMGKLPTSGQHSKSCVTSNVSYAGNHMSADMTCSGNFTGTGHIQSDWDSDEHFAAVVNMTGTHDGRTITSEEKIEGRFVSAQCGAAGQ